MGTLGPEYLIFGYLDLWVRVGVFACRLAFYFSAGFTMGLLAWTSHSSDTLLYCKGLKLQVPCSHVPNLARISDTSRIPRNEIRILSAYVLQH